MPAPATAPAFATDATYAADGDPWSGDATKVDPGATIRAEGYEPDLLPAPWLNFQLGLFGDWFTYLRTWINESTEEFKYPTTKNRYLTIEACKAYPVSTAGVLDYEQNTAGAAPVAVPRVNAAVAIVPVDIPSGCVITTIEVLVQSSGVRVTPNGWFVSVYSQSEPWLIPAAPTTTQWAATTEGGLAAGYSVITVTTGTGLTRVAESTVHVHVTGPIGALGGTDQLIAVRVSFTDGGPRNA